MWLAESTSLCNLLLFCIFLYLDILSLFLCPISDIGDGHLYFSWNVHVLKPAGEPADRLSCSSSQVLPVPPATTWCHCPSGRWHESKLRCLGVTSFLWSAWVIMCLQSSALNGAKMSPWGWCESRCGPLHPAGDSSTRLCLFYVVLVQVLCAFHKHHVGTKEQVGYVQKDIPALPIKMLILLQASWGCSVMCNKLLLYGFVSSCDFNTVFKEQVFL